MARIKQNAKGVDALLKAVLVLSRTVEYVLETRAVEAAVTKPISTSKVQILRLLGQRGSQTSTQVARFLGVSKPAVTQIMDAMMRAKLVTRRSGTQDRREVHLQLSQKGRDLFNSILNAQRQHMRNALRSLRNPNTDRWIATLEDISSALAQADEAFEHFCAQCGAYHDDRCVLVGGDATCLYTKATARRTKRAGTSSSAGKRKRT